MTIKIIESKDNPCLRRKEISAVIEAAKTPSLEEIKEKIALHEKADKGLVVIKDLRGSFGSDKFSINALVYQNKKDMDETEPKPKAKPGAPGQTAQAPVAASEKK